jgi:hypothetical protein
LVQLAGTHFRTSETSKEKTMPQVEKWVIRKVDGSLVQSFKIDRQGKAVSCLLPGAPITDDFQNAPLAFGNKAEAETMLTALTVLVSTEYADATVVSDKQATTCGVERIATASGATIDWVSEDESNTPRGEVSWVKSGPEEISLGFRGREAGQPSSWSGALVLKRTVDVQKLSGNYDEIPDLPSKPFKKVPYTVVGRFSDDGFKSFTGVWTEGVDTPSVYELNIDIE